MAWQTDEYYAQEASLLTPEEFDRIHRNQWTDPVTKAIPIEWWDRCADVKRDGKKLPPLDKKTPIVLGVDAALSHDSCAMVATSRHPNRSDEVAERATRIWVPPRGHAIDLSETVEKGVREFCEQYNVVAIVYDKYQLHKMATDLRKEGLGWFKQFDQGTKRSIADKQLLDLIIQKSITHTGNSELRTHIDNTAKKETGTRMRFVKPDQGNQQGPTRRPIDATVALSMSAFECLRLNI
jgi:phage terminase large subunit-like protein